MTPARPDDRRVVWFSRPEGAFDRYRGTAWSVADDRVGLLQHRRDRHDGGVLGDLPRPRQGNLDEHDPP
jgi:hypothetical protein